MSDLEVCSLDAIFALGICIAVIVASWFNYILNRAPGSEPDDFRIGPAALGLQCDCFINTMIVGGIVVVALAIMSSSFASRAEMYVVGITAYIIITVAGILGRRRRYEDWQVLDGVLKRSIPQSQRQATQERLDILFREDDDDDDEYGWD